MSQTYLNGCMFGGLGTFTLFVSEFVNVLVDGQCFKGLLSNVCWNMVLKRIRCNYSNCLTKIGTLSYYYYSDMFQGIPRYKDNGRLYVPKTITRKDNGQLPICNGNKSIVVIIFHSVAHQKLAVVYRHVLLFCAVLKNETRM
jgi:hypothetical protein